MGRNILNLIMVILFLVMMNYRFIGNTPHEITGIVLLALFILHNGLNIRWYKNFLKGRQSLRYLLPTIVNCLFIFAMFTTIISGFLISHTVLPSLALRGTNTIWVHNLHQGSAYASFIFMAVHLGMHWDVLIIRAKRWLRIDGAGVSYSIVSGITSVLVIGYGIYASFINHIGTMLLMQHAFGGWGAAPSASKFFVDHLAIIGCYSGITFYLMNLLQQRKN